MEKTVNESVAMDNSGFERRRPGFNREVREGAGGISSNYRTRERRSESDRPERRSYNPNFDERNRVRGGRETYDRNGGSRPYQRNGENRDRSFNRNSDTRTFNRDGERPQRSFNRSGSDRPFRSGAERNNEVRPFNRDAGNSFRRDRNDTNRPYVRSGESRPYSKGNERSFNGPRPERTFNRDNGFYNQREAGERTYRTEGRSFSRPERDGNKPSYGSGHRSFDRDNSFNRPDDRSRNFNREGSFDRSGERRGLNNGERSFGRGVREERSFNRNGFERNGFSERRNFHDDKRKAAKPVPYISEELNVENELLKGDIRLNRYISMSGVCSRRDADALITSGRITVNGEVVTELGSKVSSNDVVAFDGEIIRGERNVYILINKPKDYITTLEDPNADKIVTDLLKGQVKERVYPVGRLDKNSLGVLILTNDGEFTKIVTHPSFNKKKIYHVTLDKPLQEADMEKIATGIELEDGFIFADEISCDEKDKREVGIEIHSGRNRIVRRMFEHVGYKVRKLDRVYFAGLTKKGLQRGEWRYLTQQEVESIKRNS